MSNSLTNRDLKKITDVIKKVLDSKFEHIEKRLDIMTGKHDRYLIGLENIEKKLDKFIDILNRFSKKQDVLEEKMKIIEDYFDPHPLN